MYVTKNVRADSWSESDKELMAIVNELPRLDGPWPYICAFLNVFIAGLGTMISGCVGVHNGGETWNKTQIVVGLLQFMTSIYIFGWLWSVYWAYLYVTRSKANEREIQEFLDKTKARSD